MMLVKKLLVDPVVGRNSVSWCVVILVLFQRWKAKSANELPSHIRTVPFLGFSLELIRNKRRLHDFLLELIKKGNFQSVIIPVPTSAFVICMDARDREYVLHTHAQNFLKNAPQDPASFEIVFAELLGRGIFATDKSEWLDSRKTASHMFSGHALTTQMETVFNSHADHVVDMLRNAIHSSPNGKITLDMQEVFQCVVFDAFCEIAFDHHPKATESAIAGKKPDFLISFDFCQNLTAERIAVLPTMWSSQRLLSRITGTGPEAEFTRHLQVIDDNIYPLIQARVQETDVSQRKDLLSLYIQNGRMHNQEPSPVELRDIIVNFMIAGRDTTSCLLTYATKYLGEHLQIKERLFREELGALGQGKISWESTKYVPFADAVVNEVLRLAPPVANDFRICIEQDTLPSGLIVNPYNRILLPNMAIGRDPFLWANPESFNPERWMAYDETTGLAKPVRRVDEYVHPVFFAGRRLCLGKDMARFEAITFLAQLFSQLNITPRPNQSMDTAMGPVMFLKHGLMCEIQDKF